MTKLETVKFTQSQPPYAMGEIASFAPDVVTRLVDGGVAVRHKPERASVEAVAAAKRQRQMEGEATAKRQRQMEPRSDKGPGYETK